MKNNNQRGEHIGKPKYGYQPKGKSLTQNLDQQNVISKILQMRSNGLSFRAIADALNDQDIPTKQEVMEFTADYKNSEDSRYNIDLYCSASNFIEVNMHER